MKAINALRQDSAGYRILILGDLMLDRYTHGEAERISPEAPVLVLRAESREVRLGGAASVALLLRALGAQVSLMGVRGDDTDGRVLSNLLADAGVPSASVVSDVERPTTVKERLLARTSHRDPQPILRVDDEVRRPLSCSIEQALCEKVTHLLPTTDVVLVSDYGKGVCTPRLLQLLYAAARQQGTPVAVDPARIVDYERYRGATLVVPNRVEAALACGEPIDGPADARRAGRWLCERYDFPAALVKLDAQGIVVCDGGSQESAHFPAAANPLHDVTGAGDMVLAIVGVCQAAGWNLVDTAQLANVAAGVEVQRRGVAAVSWEDIHRELNDSAPPSKVATLAQLIPLAAKYRENGKRMVLTNGCFDLLHVGHVTFLEEAAKRGDVLVVAVNSDATVTRLKGPARPIIGQSDRVTQLAALACVAHVLVFEEDTPHRLLEQLRPDVLIKGGTTPRVVGREVVEAYGGEVCVTKPVRDYSTTRLVRRIRELETARMDCR